jgi:P-type Ca2+ transporter type 2C
MAASPEIVGAERPLWSTVDTDAAIRSLSSDGDAGLTSAEAALRLAKTGPNRLDVTAAVPAWRKFLAQLADPLIYLLLGAVGVSLIAWIAEGADGAPVEPVVIAVIILGNAVLGFVQERQAEQAVAALRRMAAPTGRVVRNGMESRIPAQEIVPGDILVLSEGDAVTADARVLHSASLTIAEAPLTGESEPVLKQVATLRTAVPLGDRDNMVFSGSAVTRGRGRAVVTATGMRTEMGRIATLLGRTNAERTPLQREIQLVGRMLGIGVVIIAIVVVGAILLTSEIEGARELVDVLLLGVSLAVAAVPDAALRGGDRAALA